MIKFLWKSIFWSAHNFENNKIILIHLFICTGWIETHSPNLLISRKVYMSEERDRERAFPRYNSFSNIKIKHNDNQTLTIPQPDGLLRVGIFEKFIMPSSILYRIYSSVLSMAVNILYYRDAKYLWMSTTIIQNIPLDTSLYWDGWITFRTSTLKCSTLFNCDVHI